MLSQLQLDFRDLAQEARKKENELKELAEHAGGLVRTLAEKVKDMSEQVKQLQTMDDVLKPLVLGLSLSASNPKLGLISISGINKLVSYGAIHESKLGAIISSINQQVDSGAMNDMTALLKVMQTVVAILTPPSPPIHQDDLAKALGICFKLHASKVPGLHQPSEASLRQVFSTIMDRTWMLYSQRKAVDENESSEASKHKQSECDRCILDSTRLVRDIVYLAGGNQPVWLSLTALDPNFCLELLEEFLTSHKALALNCADFLSIVKDRVGVLLVQLLENRRDIGFMIRLLRTSVAFLSSFHVHQTMNCVTIINALRTLLDAHQPFWMQILVLETIKWLSKDGESSFFSQIVQSDDGALKDKPQLLESYIKFIGKLGRYVTTTIIKLESADFVVKTTKPRFIDQLTYLDISNQMTPAHAISLSLSCFVSLSDSIALILAPFEKQYSLSSSSLLSESTVIPSNAAQDHSTEHLEAVYKVTQKVCDATWPSVLASLSVILGKTRDESLIQSALKSYQSFTNSLGLLKLAGPRGALLDSLVKYALPFGPMAASQQGSTTTATTTSTPSTPTPHKYVLMSEEDYRNCKFTKKNIAAMKTVLNIAHCMGSMLDSSWIIMVETLNHLNGILACTRRVRTAGIMSTGGGSSMSGNEGEFESTLLTDLSATSKNRAAAASSGISQFDLNNQENASAASEWPTREEIDILDSSLDSLFTTSVYMSDTGLVDFANTLIDLSLMQLEAMTENTAVKPFALFGQSALLKLARHNMHRVSLIWTSIHEHVLQACNSPNQVARKLVLKGVCATIEEGINAVTRASYTNLTKQDPLYIALLLMQVRFLETIEALIDSRNEHVRVETLEAMYRILQNSGSALISGWHVVLAILLNIGVSNAVSLIPLGFKSVQTITTEYLSLLPFDCLPVTISTIGNFGGKSIADININIAAIGLLWNVADFIARKQNEIMKELGTTPGVGSVEGDSNTPQKKDSTDTAQDDAASAHEQTTTSTSDGSSLEQQGASNVTASGDSFRNQSDTQFTAGTGGLFQGQETYVDSLWLALFQELAARVDNTRSEIRDCALATLYGILTTYGTSLNLPAWQSLLDKLLLPSLPWVLKQVEAANRQPDTPELQRSMVSTSNLQHSNSGLNVHASAGAPAGLVSSSSASALPMNNSHTSPHLSSQSSSAQIVLDHTRNTTAKQWQETQVSLVANMSRVFKAFLKTLVQLPAATFDRFYTTFLDHVEIFGKSPNLDVSQQAVNGVRDLLLATFSFFEERSDDTSSREPFKGQSLPPPCAQLENHAWRTWQRMSTSIGKSRTQPRLVGYFIEGIEEVFASLQKKSCGDLHIERLVSVLEPLLFVPLELAGEYTILHKQVFPLFASLTSPPASSSRHALALLPKLFAVCLTYVSNAIGFRYTPACYTATLTAMRHQLDLPNAKTQEDSSLSPGSGSGTSSPTPPLKSRHSSTFVVDRGSWNVSQASLERNFFNLAEKALGAVQTFWDALSTALYAAHPDLFGLDPDSIKLQCKTLSLQVFPDLVTVLGYAIQVKPLDARAKFWIPALELFTRVAREALPSLSTPAIRAASLSPIPSPAPSAATVDSGVSTVPLFVPAPVASPSPFAYSDIDINIIWTGVIDSIEWFLMAGSDSSTTSSSSSMSQHPLFSSSSSSSSASAQDSVTQVSEARLVELLSGHLIYICPDLPSLHERLFQILTDGCELLNREALMKQCYAALFDTVHQVSLFSDEELANATLADLTTTDIKSPRNKIRVAKLALPQLMKRCRTVISRFVKDDKRSGALPLPSARIVEISYVLDQLKSLRVVPLLWDKPPKLPTLLGSHRRHIWELFPLLCDCITAKEVEIKASIKSVFLECGQELGLED